MTNRKFAIQMRCEFTQIIEAEDAKEACKEAIKIAKENKHTAHALVIYVARALE